MFYSSNHGLHADVGAAERAAAAKTQAEQAKDRVRDLEDALARSNLVSQALWELVKEKLGLEEGELLAKIAEVDLRDGKADGRMVGRVATCGQCGRTVNTKHKKCIYCGELLPREHIFQA
ncbi:MAG: hypothetical protein QM811_27460 [Pirellulales bacterium]